MVIGEKLRYPVSVYREETPEEKLDNLWLDLQALEMDRNDYLREVASPDIFAGASSDLDVERRIVRVRTALERLDEERATALAAFAAGWEQASYDARASVAARIGIAPAEMPAHIEALRETFGDEPDWDLGIAAFTAWLRTKLPRDDPARQVVIEDDDGPTHPEPVRKEQRAIQAMIFFVVLIMAAIFFSGKSADELMTGWNPGPTT